MFDFSKLKAFADNNLNVAKMMISVCDKFENVVGKGENAGYQHLLLFPQWFSKASLSRVVKTRDCLVRVNPFPNKPWFLRDCITSLLKAQQEKEKVLVMSNISFSCSAFYLFQELSATFNKFQIFICKHFQFRRV